MGRVARGFRWVLVVLAILLVADYFRDQANHQRLVGAVARLDGRIGSILGWPLGTEYVVSFRRPLSSVELDVLAEATALRGSVSVYFMDCQLTEDQRALAVRKLPRCHVIFDDEREQGVGGQAGDYSPTASQVSDE